MITFYQHRIYREDLQANPDILYIFGDNLEREGLGGQAGEMRGEPNAYGIATKRAISHGTPKDYFFDSDPDVIEIIKSEFAALNLYLEEITNKSYKAICIPLDGIGTGLARLQKNAPRLLKLINTKLGELANAQN